MSKRMEIPSYHNLLSRKLHSIMENIGINEEMRRKMTEEATISEILHTITFEADSSVYICGSRYEGTTTKGMESDIDFLYVVKDIPAMVDCEESDHETSVLLIQGDEIPPGYAKVQLMKHGRPLFSNDTIDEIEADRIFIEHKSTLLICTEEKDRLVYSFQPDSDVFREFTRNGPSMSRPNTSERNGSDWVMALESSTLPECTEAWFTRERNFNWPSRDTLDQCKTMGCLLVPVGHPLSDDRHLQWRLSLTKQERKLVTEFNSTQLMCYVLLKLIKKDILYNIIKQDSLTSYHLKTCMFYMVENTHTSFWVPENLTRCVESCLELIQQWIQEGVCPNYFIPSENMFDGKIEGNLKNILNETLHTLLDADCKYLLQIEIDGIGERLYRSVTEKLDNYTEKNVNVSRESVRLSVEILNLITSRRNLILRNQRDFILTELFRTISKLRQTKSITDHSVEDSQRGISLIAPYLEVSLISRLISLIKEKCHSDRDIWRLLSSNKWNQLAKESDAFSVKLKQAALMCALGYHEESIHILSQLNNNVRYSICSCDRFESVYPGADHLLPNVSQSFQITAEYLLQNFAAPCIVFLPCEGMVIPDAIRYEMDRCKEMEQGSRQGEDYFWYKWAIVDGVFLHPFLLYLNHTSLGN